MCEMGDKFSDENRIFVPRKNRTLVPIFIPFIIYLFRIVEGMHILRCDEYKAGAEHILVRTNTHTQIHTSHTHTKHCMYTTYTHSTPSQTLFRG